MCCSISDTVAPSSYPGRRCKRSKARRRLTWRKRMRLMQKRSHKVLQMANLKLYSENRCMMEENKRLRQKAVLLLQENRALLSHLGRTTSSALPPPPPPFELASRVP